MSSRRRDAATAGVGYSLVAGGGILRGGAIDEAHTVLRRPRRALPASRAVLEARKLPGALSRAHRWGGGTALLTIGAPAAASGTYGLVRRRTTTAKRDPRFSAVTGLGGVYTGRAQLGAFAARRQALLRELPRGGGKRQRRPLTTPEQLADQHTNAVRAARASNEAQREKRLGDHRARQAVQRYMNREINLEKRDHGFVAEGVQGTGEAWRDKAQGWTSGAPLRVRAIPVAVGAGAAAGGSLAAHRALDLVARRRRVSPRVRAGLTAAAAVPAVVASLPVSRRLTRRHGYDPQATGGLRRVTKGWPPPSGPDRKQVQCSTCRRLDPNSGYGHNARTHTIDDEQHALFPAVRRGRVPRSSLRRAEQRTQRQAVSTKKCALCGLAGHNRTNHWRFAVHKADTVYRGPDYLGRHVTPRQQRLRVYAAGGTPVVGPVAQARQAGRYAPPGHRNSAMARQVAGATGAGAAGGVAGAYGGAELAHRSVVVARHAHRLMQGVADLKARALGRASKPVGTEIPKLLRPFAEHAAIRPLVGSRTRLIGAGVGYVAGKTIAGQIGGNVAISRNIAAQHRYDSRRMRAAPVAKSDQPLSARQRDVLARRKRRSAVMSVVAGTAGLTALGLHGARRLPRFAHRAEELGRYRETALAVGAGIGGMNAITNAEIQRREARNIVKAMALPHPGDASRYAAAHLTTTASRAANALERRPGRLRKTGAKGLRLVSLDPTPLAQSTRLLLRIHKRTTDPLRTQMTDTEAHRIVHGTGGYGLTGTLPHHLDRNERMRAYEARYLAAGGRKAAHWQRRAQHAETSRNVGLAGATSAGAVWLAASSPRVRRAARPLSRLAAHHRIDSAKVRRGAERTAVGAGTLGGAAELYEEHARAKRGSYASAPGGVAASALRRMRGYSTGEDS